MSDNINIEIDGGKEVGVGTLLDLDARGRRGGKHNSKVLGFIMHQTTTYLPQLMRIEGKKPTNRT